MESRCFIQWINNYRTCVVSVSFLFSDKSVKAFKHRSWAYTFSAGVDAIVKVGLILGMSEREILIWGRLWYDMILWLL